MKIRTKYNFIKRKNSAIVRLYFNYEYKKRMYIYKSVQKKMKWVNK